MFGLDSLGAGNWEGFIFCEWVSSLLHRWEKDLGCFWMLGAGKEFIITGLVSSLLYMKKKVIESGCLDVLVAGKEVISSRRVSCPMRCCENVIWNVF